MNSQPHLHSNNLTPCSCSFCFFFSILRSLMLRNLALPMPPALRMDSRRLARPSDGWTTSLGAPATGAAVRRETRVAVRLRPLMSVRSIWLREEHSVTLDHSPTSMCYECGNFELHAWQTWTWRSRGFSGAVSRRRRRRRRRRGSSCRSGGGEGGLRRGRRRWWGRWNIRLELRTWKEDAKKSAHRQNNINHNKTVESVCVCVYQVNCSPQRKRAAQGCCVLVLTGQSQARGLHCRTGRLRCPAGRAGMRAHRSRVPGPGPARRNTTLPSVKRQNIIKINHLMYHYYSYILRIVILLMCFGWRRAWGTCLSSCSLLVMDSGASNGFSSFSVSSVVCVFVTAPASGSRNTYFLYLWKHKSKDMKRRFQYNLCLQWASVSICVRVDSQVLGSIKEQQGADRWDVAWQAAQPLLRLILRPLLIAHTHGEIHQLLLKKRQADVEWEGDLENVNLILELRTSQTQPKVARRMQARGHTHANTVCHAELYGQGYCFWGILNNAFLHRRKLLAMFSFFFSLSLWQIQRGAHTKYAVFCKVPKDGNVKTVVFSINNAGAYAESHTQKKHTKKHVELSDRSVVFINFGEEKKKKRRAKIKLGCRDLLCHILKPAPAWWIFCPKVFLNVTVPIIANVTFN